MKFFSRHSSLEGVQSNVVKSERKRRNIGDHSMGLGERQKEVVEGSQGWVLSSRPQKQPSPDWNRAEERSSRDATSTAAMTIIIQYIKLIKRTTALEHSKEI